MYSCLHTSLQCNMRPMRPGLGFEYLSCSRERRLSWQCEANAAILQQFANDTLPFDRRNAHLFMRVGSSMRIVGMDDGCKKI